MARGVSGGKIEVNQALHGYSDGHRQLALSVSLSSRDSKTLLLLSDASVNGRGIDELGYLTGYPLTESGYYAIARTWPANELSRPGCVWTHTLLVAFTDLAMLSRASDLAGLFRRPSNYDFDSYHSPLALGEGFSDKNEVVFDGGAIDWARRLVISLYEFPNKKIIGSLPQGVDFERIVLEVWGQQWPRLRRNFRFCTFSGGDRVSEVGEFDLQLYPAAERLVRGRFSDAYDISQVDTLEQEWSDWILDDLATDAASELRLFLRQYGGDLSGGRAAFVPLVSLFYFLSKGRYGSPSLDLAVDVVRGHFKSSKAGALTALVANEAFLHADDISRQSLGFVSDHLRLIADSALDQSAAKFGRALWRKDFDGFVRLLDEGRGGQIVASKTLAEVDRVELLQKLSSFQKLIPLALACRPSLVFEPEFWRLEGAVCDEALLAFEAISFDKAKVINAMYLAREDGLAQLAVERFGAFEVFCALASGLNEMTIGGDDPWLRLIARSEDALSKVLASGMVRSLGGLEAIARATHPDVMRTQRGGDPWITAIDYADHSSDLKDCRYLAAFLLVRAFGADPNASGKLAKLAFHHVYTGVYSGELEAPAWTMLQKKLSIYRTLTAWEKCALLEEAVVDLFIYRHLSESLFIQITPDENLFMRLVLYAASFREGSKFLRGAKRLLEDEGDRGSFKWRAIERVLRWWRR